MSQGTFGLIRDRQYGETADTYADLVDPAQFLLFSFGKTCVRFDVILGCTGVCNDVFSTHFGNSEVVLKHGLYVESIDSFIHSFIHSFNCLTKSLCVWFLRDLLARVWVC